MIERSDLATVPVARRYDDSIALAIADREEIERCMDHMDHTMICKAALGDDEEASGVWAVLPRGALGVFAVNSLDADRAPAEAIFVRPSWRSSAKSRGMAIRLCRFSRSEVEALGVQVQARSILRFRP
jgi:hypothetical protein